MKSGLLWALWAGFLLGCSSGQVVENPNVPAAAFAAEGFTYYVAPPIHPEWEPMDFFFKDCSVASLGDHISKTEFECHYP